VSFGVLSGLDLVLDGRAVETIQVIGGGARSRAWRQLLADATGATIQVPMEEESGCLGAAIQAMVAHSAGSARPLSFSEVAARLVCIDPNATCIPRSELRAAYDAARAAYRKQLRQYYSI
jgi:xylulokinase